MRKVLRKVNWLRKFILSEVRKVRLLFYRVNYGEKCYFSANIYIHTLGKIKIGNACSIGEFTRIWNYALITIGDNFIGAAGLTILTGGHDAVSLNPESAAVSIGSRVWCGANVTILPGTILGDDVIVAAGAVVRGVVPNNSVIAGVPAKCVKNINRDGVLLWRNNDYKF